MTSSFIIPLWFCILLTARVVCGKLKAPLACPSSLPTSSCTSFLFYPINVSSSSQIPTISSLFNVNATNVMLMQKEGGYFVKVNCSCVSYGNSRAYFASTTYTVISNDTGGLDGITKTYFNNMAWVEDVSDEANISAGQKLDLRLLCGCFLNGRNWKAVLTYTVEVRDVLSGIARNFNAEQADIISLNNLTNPDRIVALEEVLFLPLNFSAGEIAGPSFSAEVVSRKASKLGLALGITAGAGAVIFIAVLFYVCLQKSGSPEYEGKKGDSARKSGSVSGLTCWPFVTMKTDVKHSLPREAIGVIDSDKPMIINYEEIKTATDNFSELKKIGQGGFGSVYSGHLRDQEVAIKQMKAAKSKEFLAELKVLCNVHHTNLVELIGYSAGEDSLFLVYELAENGALSDHLHSSTSSNALQQTLSWTTRAQIAIDAARGLEYIHEHTKTHYVHRDVKSSNILLDARLRAKIADFGLAKLVEQAAASDGLTTKVVGTFGYLAPEYVRDGHASSKSDVYAFGVVLFELVTGQQALSRYKTGGNDGQNQDRRSLISFMLSVLQEKGAASKLVSCIDPKLNQNYPLDAVHQMAMIARCCIEEDPLLRPDMKQIVFSLSQGENGAKYVVENMMTMDGGKCALL